MLCAKCKKPIKSGIQGAANRGDGSLLPFWVCHECAKLFRQSAGYSTSSEVKESSDTFKRQSDELHNGD